MRQPGALVAASMGRAKIAGRRSYWQTECSPAAHLAPLRRTLIDDNKRHVNVVVCESDYRALKRGIGNLKPPMQ
jgi:hypothetical protein